MNDPIQIELEFTPNPDSLKYRINRNLLARGARNYASADEAAKESKLASKLFEIEGVDNVMIGTNFVTVNMKSQDNMAAANDQMLSSLHQFMESGEAVIESSALQNSNENQNLSEIEKKIVQFLDEEVRPAVAMDGGDISFEKFEDGYVFLKMQGSCSGCPSSLMTLKMGVESRLKDVVPEVKEVIPV